MQLNLLIIHTQNKIIIYEPEMLISAVLSAISVRDKKIIKEAHEIYLNSIYLQYSL